MILERIKNFFYGIQRHIIYRYHLKQFELYWMYDIINKKQFKNILDMEIMSMYHRIDVEFNKLRGIRT